MEKLHNKYLKIKPVEHKSFISSQNDSYQEIGEVLDVDSTITDIPIGSRVKFDSFMAKKYPVEGKENEYEWYINYSEIVSHAT